MRVLIFTQHFPPETMATGRRAFSLAEGLSRAGHDVVVVTAVPNHPASLKGAHLRARVGGEPDAGRFRVLRVPLYRSPDSRPVKRLLTYSSFMVSAAWRSLSVGRPDVIVAVSPLPTGFAAVPARFWYRAPLVYDLQDIWPASAAVVGVLRANGWMFRALKVFERLFYVCCTAIVGITRGFKDYLLGLGLPSERVFVIPNGVDGRLFARPRASHRVQRPKGLVGKFVVGYIGNLGLAQNLETALDAARLLMNEPVAFVFVGDGVDKQRLQALARRHGLNNAEFLGAVSHSDVPSIMEACDALLVMLRQAPLFDITVPSKIYEYMRAGKPILCSVGGETAALVSQACCGVAVAPSDPEALAQAVRGLLRDPQRCAILGENGRRAAVEKYSSRRQVNEYARLLGEIVREHSRTGLRRLVWVPRPSSVVPRA